MLCIYMHVTCYIVPSADSHLTQQISNDCSITVIIIIITLPGLVFEINGVVSANILAYSLPGFLGAVAFKDQSWTGMCRELVIC